jgi:hypothetical protein
MSTPKQKQNPVANTEPQSQPASVITEADIAQRAYALYLERGGTDGHDLEDWLQAEQELRKQEPAAAA